MRVFLSIKYHPALRNRVLIEDITNALRLSGIDTMCIVRDLEDWGTVAYTPQAPIAATFATIDRCDLVLLELTEKDVAWALRQAMPTPSRNPSLCWPLPVRTCQARLRALSL